MASPLTLKLSASELRAMTKWPDSLIVEFLALQSGVSEITNNINIVINQIDQIITQESHTQSLTVRLQRSQQALAAQLSGLDAMPAKLVSLQREVAATGNANAQLDASLRSVTAKVASNRRDDRRLIDNLQTQLITALAQNGRLAARLAQQADQIAALTELHAIPDTSLLPRISRNADRLADLQQEMAGS